MTTTDEIRARWAETTPGPWFWWGNTDDHDVALCGRQPGLGVCEVISTVAVARDPDGADAERMRASLRDFDLSEDDIAEAVTDWSEDRWGEPRSDIRLAVTDADFNRHPVEALAVYQVARNQGLPDDTPREHPAVYRADVCDVRAPNAQALAAAWSDVRWLLGEVDRLTAELESR